MNKRFPTLLSLLLIALAIWLQVTSIPSIQLVLSRLESLVYDVQERAHVLTHPKNLNNSSIVIVDVDDISLEKEGRWPWPRAKLGALVNQLQTLGAVVIAFDMIFPQEEKNIINEVETEVVKQNLQNAQLNLTLQKIYPFFNNDAIFAKSMQNVDVVLGISFSRYQGIIGVVPPPILTLKNTDKNLGFFNMNGLVGVNSIIATAGKNVGFINVFPDNDGIIRRVPLLLRYQNTIYPSLALEAVRVYLLSNIKLITAQYGESPRIEGVQLNNYIIPTDSHAQVIIPFVGRSFTFPYFSAADVLNNKIPQGAFAGKIVFVGTSAIGLGDVKATAIQGAFPGVEIHATIADGILKKLFPYKPAWAVGAEIFFMVILGTLLALFCPHFGPRILTVIILSIPIIILFLNNILREKTGLLLDFFMPMALSLSIALLNLVYGYIFESRRRDHLKAMFGQYVPEKHIDAMLKSGVQYELSGEDREMSVLFADIRDFTKISEQMTAMQLKNYLNTYLNPMTEIIFKYHGTIDKYVGDLIMAFWGAPLPDKLHVKHAMNAALAMQREIKKINEIFFEKNLTPIQIGIGLNSGVMSVGDMGSKFRLNYTVLGDAVNLGSRIESLTKYYGVNIIVTEYMVLKNTPFLCRLLDRVRVKGKDISVSIYELICRKDQAEPAIKKEIAEHETALTFYFQQQWEMAKKLFTELNQTYPDKKLYTIYLERINQFIQTPPSSNWDGVFTLLTK
ncbi:MAG: adenylate/guanylate cyclase domain-containing protein [Gammaproteobacteria bacterium]|nr:adenylate/guanylate cyclase domain-containing protein [Gammaproteobacteria bacterium]